MRVFSGIRPSGQLHIGNYLGAIRQWIDLQNDNECFYCIVDLHAITTPYETDKLQRDIKLQATAYIAAGLDPEKSVIFVQSEISAHTELAWLLGTITPLGDLQRMTQFKEKSRQQGREINAGLLNYPILMAADILLYNTQVVPVGSDQVQHIELARELARRFNAKYGDVLIEPKEALSKEGAKIMSLQDPESKMSKTSGKNNYISLFDAPENIEKKIMRAVTDTDNEIRYDEKRKPGISNLLRIYSLFDDLTIKETEDKFAGDNYAKFKKELIRLITDELAPFRNHRDESTVETTLNEGTIRAKKAADATLQKVKGAMGLLAPRR